MRPSDRPPVTVAGRGLDAVELSPTGKDPALVFLHEGLGSIELWRSYPERVVAATGHRGLVYSRLGHGWSEVPMEQRPLDFFEREALDVLPPLLRQFDAPRPILIGHSDGASIALAHAAHHYVSALVLLAPHVFVEDFGLEEIDRLTEEWNSGDLEQKMAKYHHDPRATFFAWSDMWLDPGFRTWTMEHLLGEIRCPILLIQGLDDPYGTVAHVDAIERAVVGEVHKVVLTDCGHSPHLSQPERTLEATVQFVVETTTAPINPGHPMEGGGPLASRHADPKVDVDGATHHGAGADHAR